MREMFLARLRRLVEKERQYEAITATGMALTEIGALSRALVAWAIWSTYEDLRLLGAGTEAAAIVGKGER